MVIKQAVYVRVALVVRERERDLPRFCQLHFHLEVLCEQNVEVKVVKLAGWVGGCYLDGLIREKAVVQRDFAEIRSVVGYLGLATLLNDQNVDVKYFLRQLNENVLQS